MEITSDGLFSENQTGKQTRPDPPAGPEPSSANSRDIDLDPSDVSIGRIIQDIRSGKLSIRSVPVADRRACITHLTAEGFSRTEIAALLGLGDRMIARDRAAIRRELKLRTDPEFPEQMGGELVRLADISIEHIRRSLRDPNTPAQVRIHAHALCFKIACDLIKTLQSLGHLPSSALHLHADLTHRAAPPMTIAAVRAELDRIRAIQQECRPDDPQLLREFEMFESALTTLCQLDSAAER